MWLIPVLFSVADQDGEFAPVVGAVFRADRHAVRDAKGVASPPDGQGMSACPLQTLYSQRIEGLGQNAALGPSCGPELRP